MVEGVPAFLGGENQTNATLNNFKHKVTSIGSEASDKDVIRGSTQSSPGNGRLRIAIVLVISHTRRRRASSRARRENVYNRVEVRIIRTCVGSNVVIASSVFKPHS